MTKTNAPKPKAVFGKNELSNILKALNRVSLEDKDFFVETQGLRAKIANTLKGE